MMPEIATKSQLLLLMFLSFTLSYCLVTAQYDHHQGNSYAGGGYGGGGYGGGGGGGGGGSEHDGMDDRPKVNLGIRLRIPAFKFELPRFSLPKITVSAKIRQPEGPRVIHLPEINFDTSSKSELPSHKMHGGGGGGGGGGGYDNNYQQGPAYGMAASSYGGGQHYGGQEKATMFSFSTEEERPAYNQYQPMPTKHSYPAMRQMTHTYHQPQHQQQQQSYSASNIKPSYSVDNRPSNTDQSYQLQEPAKNPDIGFNAPAYIGSQQPAAAAEPS